jgi:hypothetical protein
MFCQARTSTLAQRALGALDLARSFLLLEDDDGVDWEVDADEPGEAPHPHRVPLRGRAAARRPGAVVAAMQVCTSPVGVRASANGKARSRPSGSWSDATDGARRAARCG